jgi:hypothetical protein
MASELFVCAVIFPRVDSKEETVPWVDRYYLAQGIRLTLLSSSEINRICLTGNAKTVCLRPDMSRTVHATYKS